MSSKQTGISLALLAALGGAWPGCHRDPTQGYTLTSPHRRGVRSVAVEMFTRGKDVYRRGLEIRLTEAVKKQIQSHTPYRLAGEGTADTLLTGTIERVSQRVMSFNPETSSPRELEMVLVVSLRWTDLRNGKVLTKHKGLRAAGPYIPAPPFDQDFFQGSEEAINALARRIVEQMEAEW